MKAALASTMYDMTRVNAKGYFDAEDSADARYAKKQAMNAQRIEDYKSGTYKLAGGLPDKLPEDAPQFVKDYYAYYKTERGYHPRSLNSNGGWNVTGCESFLNQPILQYVNEIRSAVLIMHGEKAHSCYFSRDAYAAMIKDNPYTDNKRAADHPRRVAHGPLRQPRRDTVRQNYGVLHEVPDKYTQRKICANGGAAAAKAARSVFYVFA